MTENKLVLGCGKEFYSDATHLDIVQTGLVDVVYDFNKLPLPFKSNQFKTIIIPHAFHLVENKIKFMEELYRICKPNAKIIIESTYFLSPINCQDANKTPVGWNTFDVFEQSNRDKRGSSYDTSAKFKIISREFIFSKNKANLINPLFNIFPKFYARFLYFYFPCNIIKFELQCKK